MEKEIGGKAMYFSPKSDGCLFTIKSCMGSQCNLTAVLKKYWILRGRQVVKTIVRSCIVCKKQEGTAYSTEPSPDLPDF